MSADVIDLPVITTLDLDPDRVLEQAKGKLSEVVIVGFDEDGNEYFASSISDAANVVWHLERAKHKLLNIVDGDSET